MSISTVMTFVLALCVVCTCHMHNKSQVRDKNHMKQHLDGFVDLDKMSDDQLALHYFKVHDIEGNDKLDGIELAHALMHFHAEESQAFGFEIRSFSDEELSMIIDPVLRSEDKNSDGFIDYMEFITGEISK